MQLLSKAWACGKKSMALASRISKMEIFSSTAQTSSWVNPCQILHHPSVLLLKIIRRWNVLFQNYLLPAKGCWNVCSWLLSAAKNSCMDRLLSLFLFSEPDSTLLFSLLYPGISFISAVSVCCFLATYLGASWREGSVLTCFVKIVCLQLRQYF